MRSIAASRLNMRPRGERQERILEGVGIWASYYRANIHRFAIDYLHISLKTFQIFLLYMMNWSQTFVFIASRGLGKSFISAVFCCCRCILYPGTKIVIASGTKGQSINVLDKILTELRPNSPELAMEIDERETKMNSVEAKLMFRNGSYIKVVASNDNARSNRANILIIDEFRLVKKDIADTILRKFLTSPRHPKYLDNPEYKQNKEYQELNKTLYLSSAYYADHWSYTRCKDSCRMMLDEKRRSFVCGFPYQLALMEDLLMYEDVLDQISDSDFNEIKWSMEMGSEFWGSTEGSFFNFDSISKNRHIEYAMLPGEVAALFPNANKLRIQPKQIGERRILSADIALMASGKYKNDATALFVNQMMPTKAGRFSNNIVYSEVNEGLQTEAQALRIRKLFEEFDCDYIALDVKNVGLSIFDALASELSDSDAGEVYPPLSCCNNNEIAARCTYHDAPQVIWAINGTAKFNSECALSLREGFRSGRIRLLLTEEDAEVLLGQTKGFGSLGPSDKIAIMMPYINTTLLISELINLQHEETSGLVRITEKSGARKDRYSSISYNYWVSMQIEKQLARDEYDMIPDEDSFIFRAPRQLRDERW